MTSAPHSDAFVGYAVDELNDYLEAAEQRIEDLLAAIAAARAAQPDEAPEAGSTRRRVARAWMAAQHEADTIRAQAEREGQAIIDAARRLGETSAQVTGPMPLADGSAATDWRS